MATPKTSPKPCPNNILHSMGCAFGTGVVGGSAFHFLKGIYNSPTGSRFIGARDAVRMNAPRLGGSFGVCAGLFSTVDCTMVYARQKKDPWNSIIAGAATGGFLQMRHGLRPVAGSAVLGGVVVALIEGAGIMMNKMGNVKQMEAVIVDDQPRVETKGWFGGKKEEEKSKVKDEVLESFDSPVHPAF